MEVLIQAFIQPTVSPDFRHKSFIRSPICYHTSVTPHIISSDIFYHIIQPCYATSTPSSAFIYFVFWHTLNICLL